MAATNEPIDFSSFTESELEKIANFMRLGLPAKSPRDELIDGINHGTILNVSVIDNPRKAHSIMHNVLDINMLEQARVLRTTFRGLPLIATYSMIYLVNKYENACALLNPEYVGKSEKVVVEAISWNVANKNKPLQLKGYIRILSQEVLQKMKTYWDQCKRAEGVKFIIVPLLMRNYALKAGHTNMLIYTIKDQTLERFEPIGALSPSIEKNFNTDFMMRSVMHLFYTKIDSSIKYIPSSQVCPSPKSFQGIQGREKTQRIDADIYSSGAKLPGDPGGFCMAWSIWYTDLRLSHPNYTSESLQKIALTDLQNRAEKGSLFSDFIRNYAEFLVDKVNELKEKGYLEQVKEWRDTILARQHKKVEAPFMYI